MNKKVACITGASSGLGAYVARDLVRRGYRVALLARRADRIKELQLEIEKSGGEALAIVADVTNPTQLSDAVKTIIAKWSGIDLVLANAGFAVNGPLAKLTVEDYRRQFETNVFGVLNTIYACKDDIEKTKGIIAIMGSVAGQLPAPYNTAYSMSKFAVRALALGFRGEMRKKGVKVVLISPGFIATEIAHVDNRGVLQTELTMHMPPSLVEPVEKAAPKIVDGILSGKEEVVITTHGKIFVTLNRFFPGLFRLLYRMTS